MVERRNNRRLQLRRPCHDGRYRQQGNLSGGNLRYRPLRLGVKILIGLHAMHQARVAVMAGVVAGSNAAIMVAGVLCRSKQHSWHGLE